MSFLKQLFQRLFMRRIKLNCFGRTDTGMVRLVNEDSLALQSEQDIYLVADGMGGHNGGEVASRLAIEATLAALSAEQLSKAQNNSLASRHLLIQAFRQANEQVLAAAALDDALLGMGCTLICILVSNCKAHFCHVGDVRGYLYRQGELAQITSDHSLAAESRKGVAKNIVTRCIGVTMEQDPEYHCVDLHSNDQILLCSDGLWNMVDDPTILSTIQQAASPEEACTTLIDLANEAGGRDNITALVIQVEAESCQFKRQVYPKGTSFRASGVGRNLVALPIYALLLPVTVIFQKKS